MKPRALILHAEGTNRDLDAARAFELAGAQADIVTLAELRAGGRPWMDYQILAVPGGFSYGDALGAGRLLALDLNTYFSGEVNRFVEAGKPVIGICNGFQALVKAGILPGRAANAATPSASLTFNASGRFECRWVHLQPASQVCIWTRGLAEAIYCPVAHGEGNFVAADAGLIATLRQQDQVALLYGHPSGQLANGAYPHNPNGSTADIGGVCNAAGNVLGLMPHPENHIYAYQHPRWMRGEHSGAGLPLFENGVKHAQQM